MAKNIIFVFDLDGTLVDTAPALLNAGNHVLGTIGRKPIPIEEYKGFIGGGTKKQVEKLLISTGGIPDHGLDFYFKLFQDRYYEDPVKGCSLYKGALELIELLKSQMILLSLRNTTLCHLKRLISILLDIILKENVSLRIRSIIKQNVKN